MNDIESKILELKEVVLKQQRSFKAAATRTGVIYLLLLIFVLGYTTYVYNEVAKNATPESIAAILSQEAEDAIPQLRDTLRSEMQPCAADLAAKTVAQIGTAIPAVSEFARNRLSAQVDLLIDKLEKEHIQTIITILDASVGEALEKLGKDKANLTSGTLGKEISAIACEKVREEMDKMISPDFFRDLEKLAADLKKLKNTPAAELTRQQRSARNIIYYWMALSEYAGLEPDAAGLFPNFVRSMDQAMFNFKLQIEEVRPETETVIIENDAITE